MKLKHVLAATLTVAALTACEVPEDDGTAADRAAINSKKDDKKANKQASSKAGKEADGPKETVAQANARESAESYLDMTAYSRSGLIDQLKFEGFSVKDATYGVDAQKADWKKQAAASAQSYLDMTSYSRSGLVDQLMFEGYTREQAEYGVSKTGL